jgi:DNA polymerase III alpha subunit
LNKPEELAKKCKAMGHTAVACTDHGTVGGLIDFYDNCKKNDIKPILGCEFYFTNSRFEKGVTEEDAKRIHEAVMNTVSKEYREAEKQIEDLASKGVPFADMLRVAVEESDPRFKELARKRFSNASQFLEGIFEGWRQILEIEKEVAHTMVKKRGRANHVTVLAKNEEGYRNLLSLVSLAYLEGFYFRNKIDWELLDKYGDNLIVMGGCLGGIVPDALTKDQVDFAEAALLRFKKRFGEDYYVEVMVHPGLDLETKVNTLLVPLALKHNVKMVHTQDAHYLNKEDFDAHETLLAIQTGRSLNDPNRLSFERPTFFVTSEAESREWLNADPSIGSRGLADEMLNNTVEVTNKCNVKLDFSENRVPAFQVPDEPDFLAWRKMYYEKRLEHFGSIEKLMDEECYSCIPPKKKEEKH